MQRGREIPWGFVALGAALLLAVGLVVVQFGWLAGGDDSNDVTPLAAVTPTSTVSVGAVQPTATTGMDASATATIPAYLQGCGDDLQRLVTPLEQPPPGAFLSDPGFTIWYGDRESALVVAPLDFTAVNSLLEDRGVHWFAGGRTPMLWHGAEEVLSVSAALVGGGESEWVAAGAGIFRNADTQYLEITFPEPGCWEVTAEAADAEATLLIGVAPQEEWPDFQYALTARSAEPYAPPAECGAAAWTGPNDYGALGIAPWWIDTPDAALGSLIGVLWAEEESPLFLRGAGDGGSSPLHIAAVPAEGGSPVQVTATLQPMGHQVAMVTFPTAGCWDVTVGDDAGDLVTVAVFVYPADCRRESDATPVPEGCAVS